MSLMHFLFWVSYYAMGILLLSNGNPSFKLRVGFLVLFNLLLIEESKDGPCYKKYIQNEHKMLSSAFFCILVNSFSNTV